MRAASKQIVGAVAVRLIVRRLAAAEVDDTRGLGHEANRLEAGTLVRAVAERLPLRPATRAPQIGAPLDELDLVGPSLGCDRFLSHSLALPRRLCSPVTVDARVRHCAASRLGL